MFCLHFIFLPGVFKRVLDSLHNIYFLYELLGTFRGTGKPGLPTASAQAYTSSAVSFVQRCCLLLAVNCRTKFTAWNAVRFGEYVTDNRETGKNT